MMAKSGKGKRTPLTSLEDLTAEAAGVETHAHPHVSTEPHAKPASSHAAAPRPARRRRWGRWLLLALVMLLLAAVGCGPMLVARTPLLGWLVARASGDLHGSARIESASLGWFSPVVLRNVELRDPQGQPLAQVAQVTAQPLINFLRSRTQLGTLRLEQPRLNIVLRNDGSNVEDVLGKYLAPKQNPPAPTDVTIEVVDGTIDVTDVPRNQHFTVGQFQLSAHVPAEPLGAIQIQTRGALAGAPQPGRFQATLQTDAALSMAQANVSLDGLSLSLLQGLAARLAPVTQLSGQVSSKLNCQWNGRADGDGLHLTGDLTAADFTLAAAPLGSDVLHFDQVRATCEAAGPRERVAIRQLALTCDVGSTRTTGEVRLANPAPTSLWDAVARQPIHVEGTLDLARLARLLPGTLRIQKDTQIVAGTLHGELHGTPDAQGQHWEGRLEANQLKALQAGREIAWDQPVQVALVAGVAPQGITIDRLQCASSFLQVEGSGTPENLTANARFNLNRLATELQRFVDLGGLRLAGDGQVTLQWKRPALNLKVALSALSLAGGAWSFQEPAVELTVAGQWDAAARQAQIQQAILASTALAIEADDAKLVLPPAGPPQFTGAVRYQGNLERMQAWGLRPESPPKARLQGMFTGEGRVDQNGPTATAQLTTTVENLTITAASAQPFSERQMRCACRGEFNAQSGVGQLAQLDLDSSIATCKLTGRVTMGAPATIDLGGTWQYDLPRLAELLRPFCGPSLKLEGRGSSPLVLRGPLDPAQCQGEAGLDFASAALGGFHSGPGRIKLHLAGGVLQAEPITLDVNEGKVQLAARTRVAPAPLELSIDPGVVGQQIRIDPSMCEQGLKYVAPLLAGSAQAEGRFSVQLAACRIPLDDPGRGELSGQVTIHNVQITPGAILREVASLVSISGPVQLKQESTVKFQMRDRRIYHDTLELVFPQFTLRSSGSVGLDHTLAITLEMPMPGQFLANTSLDGKLANQKLQLPIGGTLEHPAVDTRALRNTGRDVLQNAAKGVLQNNVLPQLQQLFK